MLRDDLQFLETREQAIQQGQPPESLWNLPSIASWSAGLGSLGGGSLNVVQGFLSAPLNYVKQAWFFRVDVVNLGIHWSAELTHNLGWTDSYDFNYRSSLLKGSEEAWRTGNRAGIGSKPGGDDPDFGPGDRPRRVVRPSRSDRRVGGLPEADGGFCFLGRRRSYPEGAEEVKKDRVAAKLGGEKPECPLRRAVSRLEAGRLEVSPFKEYYLKNLPLLPSRLLPRVTRSETSPGGATRTAGTAGTQARTTVVGF